MNAVSKWFDVAWPSIAPAINYVCGEVAAQRERMFLWLPVFLALGVAVYFALPFEPPLAMGLFAALFSFSFLILSYPKRYDGTRFYSFMLTGLVLSLMSSGFLASQVRTILVHTPMITKEIKFTNLTGTIESIEPLEEGAGSRVTLSHLSIEELAPKDTPRRVRLRLRADDNVQAGQRVKALAGLNPPFSPVIPGAFDFQRYSYFQEIGAVGFIYKAPEVLAEPKHKSWHLFWENIRLSINDKIQAHMDYPQSAVAQALITGKRKAITEEDQKAIRDAGLAHMLAISGLHVGLVSAVIFFFTRLIMAAIQPLALRYPIKKYAAVFAFFGALFYTLMVGAPIPTQRAMMMTGVVLLAIVLDRSAISLRLVALAAAIVLLFAPESLMSASFQMSFAAVTALVAFYEMIQPQISSWYSKAGFVRKAALYFIGVCMTTLIASLATAPFSLFHFQHFASLGLIGNLVAVPLMAFVIMPMGVLSLILMPLGLDSLPMSIMQWGIAEVLNISHFVSEMPNAVAHSTAWPVSGLLWLVTGGLFFMLWSGPLRILSMVFIGIGIININQYNQNDIYISSSHKLIGFRDVQGDLNVSSRRSDRFVLENWERANGLEEGTAKTWPKEGHESSTFECGEYGCHLQLKGKKIAFSKHPAAHSEDCDWADIVITDDVLKEWDCDAPYVIDKIDTWKNGAHAILLEKGKDPIIRNALEPRGKRPWVISVADN